MNLKEWLKSKPYWLKGGVTGIFLDLVVLTRGGGSLEDLQSFNDESVARAIFSSKSPVVCGVGHEDDMTIADLVSDVRASTPSNAAEIIVRNRTEVLREVNSCVKTIETADRVHLRHCHLGQRCHLL